MPELPRPLPPPTWRDRLAVVASWRDGVPLPALIVVVAVVAAVCLGASTLLRSNAGRPDVALSLPRADGGVGAGAGDSDSSGAATGTSTTTSGSLRVHAAGAVAQPGVVEVRTGARVIDVVNAAGGPSADADLNQVNLAELVADAQRVYIPRVGEAAASVASSAGGGAAGAKSAADGIVNINEASESELEALPGVGPATAKAIVAYRTEHGRFRSVEDLLNVRGIGPAKLEQIKPHARV